MFFVVYFGGYGDQYYDFFLCFYFGNGVFVYVVYVDVDMFDCSQGESCGVMINYFYEFVSIEQNYESFVNYKQVIVLFQV